MNNIDYLRFTIYYLKQNFNKNCKWSIINGKSSQGQALITLLFFIIIGLTVITATSIMVVTNVTAGSNIEQGTIVLGAAESGVENALIQLLRNPSYTGEAPFTVGNATVNVSVNNGTIIATASANSIVRKIQTQTVYNNNVLQISSWKEIQ